MSGDARSMRASPRRRDDASLTAPAQSPVDMARGAFRMVRIRKSAEDADSRPPGFFGGGVRRPPVGVAGNAVRTTKYLHSPATALPKQLFFQFRRAFNIFWLIQCVIVLVPGLAPYTPATTLAGFCFVLAVSCAKDFYEDYQRLKADHGGNAQPVEVLRDGAFVRIPAWHLLVGDVVRVVDGEQFPVDLLVLTTSDPTGPCHVETSNLDGERNLKRFFAMAATAQLKTAAELHSQLHALVIVDEPNDKLYALSGQLRLKQGPIPPSEAVREEASDTVSAINAENVCLRGSRLKQTDWIIGVTVYAGMESKIQMNAMEATAKFSAIERALNNYINYLFVFILALCALLTAGTFAMRDTSKAHAYFGHHGCSVDAPGMRFFTYLVLLNAFIPLSLMVTLELAIFAQAIFLMWDDDMKTEGKGSMTAYTSSLNGELGQIDYVFSDKTGTLTKNIMHFKHCSIGGRKYLNPMTGELAIAAKAAVGGARDAEASLVQEYLRALTVCNDVVPDKGTAAVAEGQGHSGYHSASPDETALVEASAVNGVELCAREKDRVLVREVPNRAGMDSAAPFEIVATLPFTSDRRRMSVVVKTPEGKHVVYCKGADMVMVPRCRGSLESSLRATVEHMEDFSCEGYRTLVVARRVMAEDEVVDWTRKYAEASRALTNREALLADVYASLETGLECLGATAVEDQLQDNVPQTVEFLLKTGIHVWILTGDKLETAMTIAYSSSILTNKMAVGTVDATDYAQVTQQVAVLQDLAPREEGKALVIGGAALALLINRDEAAFVALCGECNVVVCARCAPAQKAEVVSLVMKRLNKVSLAIGDGGNDVPMIMSAHVGVGITGNEGMQAARSSDYAVGEFQKLKKLLAVHGRYNSIRITDLIKCSFYKNVTFCLPQVVMALFNLFSGGTIHNAIIILAWNISMTGLPPLIHAIFEKDLDEKLIYAWPQLYSTPERKRPLAVNSFLLWFGHAIFQGAIFGFLLLFGSSSGEHAGGGLFSGQSGFNADGTTSSADELGFILSTAIFLGVTAKLVLLVRHWTVIPVVTFALCLAVYFAMLVLLDGMFCPGTYGEITNVSSCGIMGAGVLANGHSWLLILLVVSIVVAVDLLFCFLSRTLHPEMWQVVQEMGKFEGVERPADEAAALRRQSLPLPPYVPWSPGGEGGGGLVLPQKSQQLPAQYTECTNLPQAGPSSTVQTRGATGLSSSVDSTWQMAGIPAPAPASNYRLQVEPGMPFGSATPPWAIPADPFSPSAPYSPSYGGISGQHGNANWGSEGEENRLRPHLSDLRAGVYQGAG